MQPKIFEPLIILLSARKELEKALHSIGAVQVTLANTLDRNSQAALIIADFTDQSPEQIEKLAEQIVKDGDAIIGFLSEKGYRPQLFLDGEAYEIETLERVAAELMLSLSSESEVQSRFILRSKIQKIINDPQVVSMVEEVLSEYVSLYKRLRSRLEEHVQELKRSRDQLAVLSAITTTFPNAIIMLDANAHIHVWNKAAEKLFGWTAEEIKGLSIFETLIPSEETESTKKMLQEEVVQVELQRRSKSGEMIPVELTAFNVSNAQGEITGRVGVFRDLREMQKLQKSLIQSEKMAAVGQLAGGVAHEINNPLGVILGFAQSIAHRIKSDDPLSLPVQSIEREAKRCKNLVQDLLTFSRVGKTEKEKCDLNQLIESALSLVEAESKVEGVELVKEFSQGLPPVTVNRNRVQQVIINLCNNAMDAMPDGGTLKIQTQEVEKNGQRYVEIQIQDTGTGIPKEIQSKIFEPFFTTKEVGKGTGLGLPLVYEIIQKQQGSIEVVSEVGKGTVFHILLPVAGEAIASPSQDNLILIVEDEPEVMRMIQRTLLHSGMKFIATDSGFEAGKLLAEKKPQLIILDIFLPGMDGFKICEKIRSDEKLREIKILAISGSQVQQTAKKIIEVGADDFLGKPFSPEQLKERILKLLSK